jgi:hypothetical protein
MEVPTSVDSLILKRVKWRDDSDTGSEERKVERRTYCTLIPAVFKIIYNNLIRFMKWPEITI